MTSRERFASVKVARLATVDASGAPHIVPITFAVEGDLIVTGVDHKPKRSTRLRRLDNIAREPRVAVLADHYEDEWTRLWWVRADGVARIVEPGSPAHTRGAAMLARRYPDYMNHPISGPIIEIEVTSWSSWAAAAPID